MKSLMLNAKFTALLLEKIPHKPTLANFLITALAMDKEAIYRRLRGDVPFTFAEVCCIAQFLAISIDELFGIESENRKPFHLIVSDFVSPSDEDQLLWQNYNSLLEHYKNELSLHIYEAWNSIPFYFSFRYPNLLQFYVFKWSYHTYNHTPFQPFESIKVEKHFQESGLKTLELYMESREAHFIIADEVFLNLVKDLKFFERTRLITRESMIYIQKEVEDYLNYMEKITADGCFRETGNKVFFYISEVQHQINISLFETENNYIGLLRTLAINSAATTSKETYMYMKNWFNALRRLSTQISISGESERIKYLNKQREIIKTISE